MAHVIENPKRVFSFEILKLNQTIRPFIFYGETKFCHHGEMRVTRKAGFIRTQIEVVRAQSDVVCAQIQANRHRLRRIEASTRNVETHFSNRDGHPICAQIAETEHSASIRDDDDFGLGRRPIIKHPSHHAGI